MKLVAFLLLSLLVLLLLVNWPSAGNQQSASESLYRYTDALGAQVYLHPVGGLYLVEINPQLSNTDRELLKSELARLGLELVLVRPEGFPKAGEPQTISQEIWACRGEGIEPAAAVRGGIEVNKRMRAGLGSDAVLGVLPVFRGQEGGKYTYFRPAYIGVALKHDMARANVGDSIVHSPWVTEVVDSSTQETAYAKYVFRRVALRVDISVGVFAALDSLRESGWLRGASPIGLDWQANLGAEDVRRVQWELATGNRAKLKGGVLVFIANALDVDGPDAALELARTEMNADSAGRLRLVIDGRGDLNKAKSDLLVLDISIIGELQYELESEPRVHFVVDLPPQLLNDLIELSWVTKVEFHTRDGIRLNSSDILSSLLAERWLRPRLQQPGHCAEWSECVALGWISRPRYQGRHYRLLRPFA